MYVDDGSCIYCTRAIGDGQESLEHIVPSAMGGKICSELFKTRRVCKSCNNLSGLFVDGSFLRSRFVKNDLAAAAREYLRLDGTATVPLNYMGVDESLSEHPSEVCEIWTGPCGDHIYHLRPRDEAQFNSYAGGNPIRGKQKPGRAYLFVASRKREWIDLAFRSFALHFDKAERYSGNVEWTDQNPWTLPSTAESGGARPPGCLRR